MTRQLAKDALRYVSRVYKDDAAQRRKMEKRHGYDDWFFAVCMASAVYYMHGHNECMAVLEDMVYRAIDGRDKT